MSGAGIVTTPSPPYYAVIFTSKRTSGDNGYGTTADRMVRLAKEQPGYLGMESARGSDGIGITVSYWSDPAAIRAWKAVDEHQKAQEGGKASWYEHYEVRIAKVERAYSMPKVL